MRHLSRMGAGRQLTEFVLSYKGEAERHAGRFWPVTFLAAGLPLPPGLSPPVDGWAEEDLLPLGATTFAFEASVLAM